MNSRSNKHLSTALIYKTLQFYQRQYVASVLSDSSIVMFVLLKEQSEFMMFEYVCNYFNFLKYLIVHRLD